jgi:hypothetical protein
LPTNILDELFFLHFFGNSIYQSFIFDCFYGGDRVYAHFPAGKSPYDNFDFVSQCNQKLLPVEISNEILQQFEIIPFKKGRTRRKNFSIVAHPCNFFFISFS